MSHSSLLHLSLVLLQQVIWSLMKFDQVTMVLWVNNVLQLVQWWAYESNFSPALMHVLPASIIMYELQASRITPGYRSLYDRLCFHFSQCLEVAALCCWHVAEPETSLLAFSSVSWACLQNFHKRNTLRLPSPCRLQSLHYSFNGFNMHQIVADEPVAHVLLDANESMHHLTKLVLEQQRSPWHSNQQADGPGILGTCNFLYRISR